jgi:hypothetical protein
MKTNHYLIIISISNNALNFEETLVYITSMSKIAIRGQKNRTECDDNPDKWDKIVFSNLHRLITHDLLDRNGLAY